MKEIYDIVKAVNRLTESVEFLIAKINLVLKHPNLLLRNKYYDSKSVCTLLHSSQRTLLRLRNSGDLPYVRINHRILYLASDIDKFLIDRKIQ